MGSNWQVEVSQVVTDYPKCSRFIYCAVFMSRFLSFWAALRQYRFPAILFCLCFSAVLLFPDQATSTQRDRTHSLISTDVAAEIQRQPATLSLTQDVRKTVLENGLTVLTKEVHTAPVVSVQVWYKIGSRNEAPGVNGIAHQLEHMLFKGTTNRPVQFGRLFSALGSDSNAFTSFDKTAYFGTVERNKLKALLTLEADRMQNALINAEQLSSEKRVVISELQGYENNPSYRLSRAVMRAAFPNHPYGLSVGGTKADVEKFTLEQVRYYYQNYYSPDNATLVIVGDFATEPTLKAIQESFGKVPKRSVPKAAGTNLISQNQTPVSQKPIELREPGSASLLQVVYPAPDANHPDVPAVDVMDFILREGRSSRLYQALVESGLVSNIRGGAANLIAGGWYELSATAAPGQNLSKIDQVLQQAIADLKSQPVTEEELNRAKTQIKAAVILSNRSITDQARQLANDQTISDDFRYTDRYLAGIEKVSIADVQRVAQTYLKETNRTVGFFEPTQPTGKTAAGTTNANQTSESFNLGSPVDPAEVAKYLPPVDSATSTTQSLPTEVSLANGLRVLLLPDPSTPTITLNGYIRAGTEFDVSRNAGLAELTAQNLMNGTKTKDALALAKSLEAQGVSLEFRSNREGVLIDGDALATNLPTLMQVLGDVLQNATFPTNELELSRQRS